MITFKDYFFYTPSLNPGTLLKRSDMVVFKGISEEEYQKIKEEYQKKNSYFLKCINCSAPTNDCRLKKVV